jgi:hypothetical protein
MNAYEKGFHGQYFDERDYPASRRVEAKLEYDNGKAAAWSANTDDIWKRTPEQRQANPVAFFLIFDIVKAISRVSGLRKTIAFLVFEIYLVTKICVSKVDNKLIAMTSLIAIYFLLFRKMRNNKFVLWGIIIINSLLLYGFYRID